MNSFKSLRYRRRTWGARRISAKGNLSEKIQEWKVSGIIALWLVSVTFRQRQKAIQRIEEKRQVVRTREELLQREEELQHMRRKIADLTPLSDTVQLLAYKDCIYSMCYYFVKEGLWGVQKKIMSN